MSRTGVNLYDRSASNVRGSLGLMLVFAGLAFAVGWAVGVYLQAGWGPSVVMLVVALVMVWGSYFASDGIALGMARAREAQENDFTQLHNVVEGISLAAGIPKPGIYVIEDPAPNAFATGRNPKRGAVAVTTGLLEKMNRDELEGVIAHELSHIKNRDTLVMTISVTLIGLVVLVGDLMLRAVWLGGGRRRRGSGAAAAIPVILAVVLLILAPIFARLLHFAISRRREFLADSDAALLTRHPSGLISALRKLGADRTVVRTASRAAAHLWIESPIDNEGGRRTEKAGAWLNRLFLTHPPIGDRIKALGGEA